MNSFIKGLITFALKNRLMIFLMTLLVIAAGIRSFLMFIVELPS